VADLGVGRDGASKACLRGVRRPTARSAVCGAPVDERDRDKTRVAIAEDGTRDNWIEEIYMHKP